jgi:AbrB family looped-hinge helix DNA binding protein
MKRNGSNSCSFPEVAGTTVLGERGQIVIPKESREALLLTTGDKFVVLRNGRAIILIPAIDFKQHLAKISALADILIKL